jgi:hypothetical protein
MVEYLAASKSNVLRYVIGSIQPLKFDCGIIWLILIADGQSFHQSILQIARAIVLEQFWSSILDVNSDTFRIQLP